MKEKVRETTKKTTDTKLVWSHLILDRGCETVVSIRLNGETKGSVTFFEEEKEELESFVEKFKGEE